MQEEKASRLFHEFRLLSIVLQSLDEKHPEFQKRRRILLGELLDISKEWKPLTEIKDILDEIKIIQTTLQDQLSVLNSDEMRNLEYEVLGRASEKAKDILSRADRSFAVLQTRAEEVEKSVSCGVPQPAQKTKFGAD
jgi:DNA repair ATPase RecN